MAKPTDTATPTDSPIPIALAEITPSVTSSTCLFKTKTAGSAATTKKPMANPTRMSVKEFVFSIRMLPS